MILDPVVVEVLGRIGLTPADLSPDQLALVRDHLSPAEPKGPPTAADEGPPVSLASSGETLRAHLGLPPSPIAAGAGKLRRFLDASTPAPERDALWAPAPAGPGKSLRAVALDALRSTAPTDPDPGDAA